MDRRRALKAVAATLPTAIAGCTTGGGGDGETDLPTGEPTETPDAPYVRYFVTNEDDETHPLDVVIETADGAVVHEQRMVEFAPGEQISATVAGLDATEAPYPITISLESLAETIEWKADECPRFDLSVVVDSEGQLTVDRELCIK